MGHSSQFRSATYSTHFQKFETLCNKDHSDIAELLHHRCSEQVTNCLYWTLLVVHKKRMLHTFYDTYIKNVVLFLDLTAFQHSMVYAAITLAKKTLEQQLPVLILQILLYTFLVSFPPGIKFFFLQKVVLMFQKSKKLPFLSCKLWEILREWQTSEVCFESDLPSLRKKGTF